MRIDHAVMGIYERAPVRLSIDVGGTFTDLVLIDDAGGRSLVDKVPSTPGSARAVIESIGRITRRAGTTTSDLGLVLHGFTIATNAWLTRTGSRVVLLTTEGFRDVLALGSQRRPDTYDLGAAKPEPLVPRSRVVEVAERVDAFGQVVTPLDETETARVLDAVAALDPEALAVSLLFSWANPVHERRLAAAFGQRFPDRPVYCSCEVNPEIEEYPRANTTAAAAYVGPPVRQYTESLEADLAAAGIAAPLRYMRSDGGSATARSARGNPAAMLLSGPAGGVVAALALGETLGVADLITFDMGGTSADFSVVRDGRAATVRDRDFDGLPLRVPMLEIKAISAGGGSIGNVHAVGVGVQSRPPDPPPDPARESDPAPRAWRSVPIGAGMSRARTPVYHRDDLAAESRVAGPAIVVQNDSTLVVLAGQTARVGRLGFIHVTEEPAKGSPAGARPDGCHAQ